METEKTCDADDLTPSSMHLIMIVKCPSLLKEWQDVVLTHGWAYGSKGIKLRGKDFMLAISIGGSGGISLSDRRFKSI